MRTSDTVRLIAVAAIGSASFMFMRVVAPVMGTMATAFMRVLLGALGLMVMLAVFRSDWRFKGKLGRLMALGLFASAAPFLLYSHAATVLPAGYSAILNATTPLMGVIMGAMFFSVRLTLSSCVSVLLGIVGVLILARSGPLALTPAVLLGVAECLLATVCFALAGYLTQRWITATGGLDSKLVAFGSLLGATLMLLPFLLFGADQRRALGAATLDIWGAMLTLGLVCTAYTAILYFRLIADIGPVKSLTVALLTPPFALGWSVLFLGEQVTWAHAAGAGTIALAVWMLLKPVRASMLTERN